MKLGRGKDAISSCSEALELDGELVQRGESKLLTEDWEGAIVDLNEAAEKSPQICCQLFLGGLFVYLLFPCLKLSSCSYTVSKMREVIDKTIQSCHPIVDILI